MAVQKLKIHGFSFCPAWCAKSTCRKFVFPGKMDVPGFVHYVNSRNCQKMFSIYEFCDLSKKTRPGKSWVWAVPRPPDLLQRADW